MTTDSGSGGSQTDVVARPALLDASRALDKLVLFALEEAQKELERHGELEPFTVVLCGENLFVERQPGASAQECLESAARTVQNLARLAQAYVFVYDGYVGTLQGRRDALIAERGISGERQANAYALLYSRAAEPAESLRVEPTIFDLGSTASLLEPQPQESAGTGEV